MLSHNLSHVVQFELAAVETPSTVQRPAGINWRRFVFLKLTQDQTFILSCRGAVALTIHTQQRKQSELIGHDCYCDVLQTVKKKI